MLGRSPARSGKSIPSQLVLFGRASLLLLPTVLMTAASLRSSGNTATMLWLGTAFQVIVCVLSFLTTHNWRQPVSPSVITLYLIALCWIWWADDQADWFTYLAKALLLAVPVAGFC